MDKKIYCFIHIPKTSGSFIKQLILLNQKTHFFTFYNHNLKRKILDSPFKLRYEHLTLDEIKSKINPNTDISISYFSIVRNPYDRIYSIWNFFKDNNFNDESIPKLPDNYKDFLLNYCSGVYDDHYLFKSQIQFLGNNSDDVKIFKYENRLEINNFFQHYGINNIENKPLNSYESFYDEKMKNILYDKLEEEFNTFNYLK